MLFDFFQFISMYVIMITGLRLLQNRTKDTEWGKAFAFFG